MAKRPKRKRSPARAPRSASQPQRPSRAAKGSAPTVAPAAKSDGHPASNDFPVVGIGASAGGLEALEAFLRHVPAHSGMAYVVIQHLDPTHKGAMVELLQRSTTMPVVEVRDRLKVEPDSVYVIPPNKDMSILHGLLHLLPQTAPRGLNLPIDFFFRSLADDRQDRSIGVVLSGMGSDGTLGLRAIKEKAGAAFAQSLDTAKFSGMPRSAIEAGLADVAAPAEELPARIVAYHQHAPYVRKRETEQDDKQVSALDKVFILLRSHTGNDFSHYKRSTINRRIERRMGLHQIDRLSNYVRYLRDNPREVDLLFKELLIGVTSFFRDPPAWDHLRDEVLPGLLRSRKRGGVVRAWVPGCSTGEEAYSLAMVLCEAMDRIDDLRVSLQIFATDLDREAVEKARVGVYPANIAADVTPERLRRFFIQDDQGYRVRQEIRESVVFAPQNIIMDPPFTKLDILSCRNLLIYLAPELQRKIIPLFHYALNPGGVLFLGTAETVGTHTALFLPVDAKSRIFRRLEPGVGAPAVEFPPGLAVTSTSMHLHGRAGEAEPEADGERPGTPPKVSPPSLSLLADRAIIQHLSPAAVLTNDKGDILYISGRTGKYLEPATGKANLNVFAMAREGMRYELSSAFASALRKQEPVTIRALKVASNGSSQSLDLTVQKLAEPKELRGTMLISLAESLPPSEAQRGKAKRTKLDVRVIDLERELQHAREELQTTREEMQTSQEELKSTNEELQSTNEELQSTNEELTTSKEEMQSMNEELQTVNHELQSKVDELSRSNNDMKNLLNSTDIATLFLDSELLVRRFTTQTTKIIKLIPADTGRPITDIASDLDYPGLADDSREVLRTLVFKDRDVPARDGRWFNVRILPYRTLENVIDGVVITFTEVTAAKTLETTLREQAGQLKHMTESLPNLVWTCRPDGSCESLSQQWLQHTGVPEARQVGWGWLEQVHRDERDVVRSMWKNASRTGQQFESEFRIHGKDDSYRWFKTIAVPVRDPQGKLLKWYCTCIDVDDLKRAAEERSRAAERIGGILEAIDDAFISLDEELRVTYFNAVAERLFARKRADVLGKSLFDAFPTAGAPLETKLREAMRARSAASFEGELTRGARFALRVFPHAGGVSMFCRPGSTIGA